MAFVRCKDPRSGDEFTVDEVTARSMGVTVLDKKDAVDVNGRPLPPKKNTHKGGSLKAADDKKDG